MASSYGGTRLYIANATIPAAFLVDVTETLEYEFLVDFSVFTPGARVMCVVSIDNPESGVAGDYGTWRVRYGGTVGALDGTLILTATEYNATGNVLRGQAAFANPGTPELIKLSHQYTALDLAAFYYNMVFHQWA